MTWSRGAVVALAMGCMAPVCRAQAPSGPAAVPGARGGLAREQKASAAPSAQASRDRVLKITAPAAGEYTVTILPSPDAGGKPQLPATFTGTEGAVTFDPGDVGRSPLLTVDDARTGLSLVMPLPKREAVTLHALQFDRARTVEVRITYDGKPLRTAVVTLVSGKQSSTVAVDEVDRGVARFDRVALGKARLEVLYGASLRDRRDIEVKPPSGGGPVVVPVAVSSAAPTLDEPALAPKVAAPAASAPSSPPPAPPAQGGGGLVSILGQVLGILLVAGLAYGLYRWFQSGGMAATLQRAGIEVSGPQPPSDAGAPWAPNAPAPPVVADPAACQFCGQRKGPAGECACTVAPGSVLVGLGSSSAPQPRLIGSIGAYAGAIFSLSAEGEVIIGRDAGSAVPLSDDSTVSRRHASVRAEAGAYTLTDLGSSNGVYVNGVRIAGSQPLRPGDEVQIGSTRFRFEV